MKTFFVITFLFLFVSQASAFDEKRYAKCYGEMTVAHKARGFHQSQRATSIKVKETVCRAYANGEDIQYEGKQGND